MQMQKIYLRGQSLPWSYGNWIYNYLCNQCPSPLMLWVRISIRARSTTLCDKICQYLATGQWFSPGPPVSSTNKTDHHDITEILLKVALNIMKQTARHIPIKLRASMKIVTIIFPNSLPQIDLKSYDLFVIFFDTCFLDNVEGRWVQF